MKINMARLTTLAFSVLNIMSVSALAANSSTSDRLESLGRNQTVIDRANRLESRTRVAIVQDREVNRNLRLEIGGNYGPVASGDAYLRTQNAGAELNLHFTPKFSLGVRYAKSLNSLSDEGVSRFQKARQEIAVNRDAKVPGIDYPEETVTGLLNWYMTYGKINLFDIRTVQFDIYSLAGYGQVTLASGPTPTWTAGGGVGFWLSQHLTSRFELRYQTYTDQPDIGVSRNLNLIIGTIGFGVLL